LTLLVTIVSGALYLAILLAAILHWSLQPQLASRLGIYAAAAFLLMLGLFARQVDRLGGLQPVFQARLALYGLLTLAGLFHYLTAAFLRLGGRWQSAGWLAAGGLTGLGVLLEADPFTWGDPLFAGPGWAIWRANLIFAAAVTAWGVLLAWSLLLAWRELRNMRQPDFRNRVKFLAPGLALLALGDGLVFANLEAAGLGVHLMGVLIVAYAALTLRLPPFRRAVLRSASYLITTLIGVSFYGALFLGARYLLALSNDDLGSWLLAGLAALIGGIALHPALTWVQRRVEMLIAGAGRDPTYILRRYSQSISNVLDVQLLAKVAIGVVNESLHLQKGALYLVEHEKGREGRNIYRLRGVKGIGEEAPIPGQFIEESPAAQFLRNEHRPLRQFDLELLPRFSALPPAERAWFDEQAYDLYVPVYAKGEWIGLLALGPRRFGAPFSDEDQEMLMTLADQTAVALENARLVEGLMRLNSEFRRAYTALEQANRHLERLDRTKTDFISIASHELRTPLTLLSGYSQMLMEDPLVGKNPQYAKMLEGITSGAQRLHEVVESMLDMAAIETGDMTLDRQPLSPALAVTQAVGKLRPAAKERSLSIEVKSLDDLPAIEADGEALAKVLRELLLNAIKYTPDGGQITIEGRALDPEMERLPTGGVELVVSDSGIGIDPRVKELIFMKFYQTGELSLHSTGKTKFKGAGPGLGLAIVKGLVEAHGGWAWAESEAHDEIHYPGSSFHVVLPVKKFN
jgi:signal transduction histidine kinase